MKFKYVYIKIINFIYGIKGVFSNSILLNYCIENNAGDSFNKDFLQERFSIKIGKYSFGRRPHYIFCGSILAKSNINSIVVGAGFISEEQAKQPIKFKEILGVRGKLSEEYLKIQSPNIHTHFLGDPGLLAREIVKPRSESYTEKNIIGIIPHFIDIDIVQKIIGDSNQFKLIDIRNDFKSVCEEILTCDVVLSSSLHGLIFSDSMNVPNMWIKLSDNIKGGTFKFHDYYSVMKNAKENYFECTSIRDFEMASLKANISSNPKYQDMKEVIDRVFK